MRSIPLFKVHMPRSVYKPLKKVLQSGFIGQGPKVEEFEECLRQYFKWEHIHTTNSCTSALQIALRLLEVGLGDEVISSPLTFVATNWTILASGAKVVWADVNPTTCNIDIDSLLAKITNKTKAIMFVHWGGYPIDVDMLAAKILFHTGGRVIPLIEDCAHSLGATLYGQFVGTFGNLSAFSLQAIKHITTIDGGLLFTPKEFQKQTGLLRWFGIDRTKRKIEDLRCEPDILEWGYKANMSDVSAVLGIEQLKYLDRILSKHRSNATYYNKMLAPISGIQLLEPIKGANPSYWMYTFKVEKRSAFITKMKELGVVCSKVHERNDIHTCVKDFVVPLPLLDSISDHIVSIPVGWWVTKEDREYIIDCIKKGW